MALKIYVNADRDKLKPRELSQLESLIPGLSRYFASQDAVLLAGDILLKYRDKYSNPIDALLITPNTVVLLELKTYKQKGEVYCDAQGKVKIADDYGTEVNVKGGNQGSPLNQVYQTRDILISYVFDFLKELNLRRFDCAEAKGAQSQKFPAFIIINGDNESHPIGSTVSPYEWAHVVNNEVFIASLEAVLSRKDVSLPKPIPIDALTDRLGFTKGGKCAAGYLELDPTTGEAIAVPASGRTSGAKPKHVITPGTKSKPVTNSGAKPDVDLSYGKHPVKTGQSKSQQSGQSRESKIKSLVRVYLACTAVLICLALVISFVFKKFDSDKKFNDLSALKMDSEQLYQSGLDEYAEGNVYKAEEYFAKAAAKGHSKAAYNLGRLYYNDGNYKESLSLFQQSAASDDCDALFFLGVIYSEGRGVVKDLPKALEYWKSAADKGSFEAMYSIGEYYYNLKEYASALTYFKVAASRGHAPSMYLMSIFYDYGLGGLDRDPSTARKWENLARENGYVPELNQ